jgi:AraC-like DNA-binding protein
MAVTRRETGRAVEPALTVVPPMTEWPAGVLGRSRAPADVSGALGLVCLDGGPMTITGTPAAERSDSGRLKVGVQTRGNGLLTQDGREAALDPGDVALYDAARPYELSFEHDFQLLVLTLPQHAHRGRRWQLADLTARRIPGSSGMGAVLSPFLTLLASRVLSGDVQPSRDVCDAVLDLLTATCRAALGDAPESGPRSAHRALLLRIQADIEQRLGEPSLCAAEVAAANHISVRYLQKLFQEAGSTASSWIRVRRLERCRRDLTDPRLAHVPVSAIGSRWGYPDAANFARAFRSVYAEAPSALRARALGAAATRWSGSGAGDRTGAPPG